MSADKQTTAPALRRRGRWWRASLDAADCIEATLAGEAVVMVASDGVFQEQLGVDEAPLLVLFDAPWCVPGRQLAERLPTLNCPDDPLGERLRFARVDVEALPRLAGRYSIAAVPMLLLFRNAQVVARRIGDPDLAALRAWLVRHI